MIRAVLAICVGASTGALLRWVLGLRLNALVPLLPVGTLAANLIGGYVVGVAVAYFADTPHLSPEWRLLVITGFCGGLTTFSTFGLDTLRLVEDGSWLVAGAYVTASLVVGLAAVAAGWGAVSVFV